MEIFIYFFYKKTAVVISIKKDCMCYLLIVYLRILFKVIPFWLFSIARNKAGGDTSFVTSDEDRTVRYWQNGVNTETFLLPAQSVWTVTCLSNGDIVTGSR